MNTHDSNTRRSTVSWPGVALAALVSLAAGADLDAQTAAPQEPRFEVVFIKRSTGDGAGSMMAVQPGGRVSVRNLPVQEVIRRAYGILSFQLTGGSDWLQGERYDIEAKASDGAVVTADAIKLMLRAMLSDRFKLKVRRETRESAIYELVLARSDSGSARNCARPAPTVSRSATSGQNLAGHCRMPRGFVEETLFRAGWS